MGLRPAIVIVPRKHSASSPNPAVSGSIPLANGFGTIVVVNTDQGFIQSNPESQYLFGSAALDIPTVLSINGVALRPFDRVPWEVPGVIAVKLLIHPLASFALMLALGPFAQPWAATAVLMASLPPALNVFVIARQNDAWIESASVAVLLGTFASVVTLTSVMWMIQTGRLAFP